MNTSIKASWLDREFYVHPPTVPWRELPAVYIFCGVTPQNVWHCLYIGQAENLKVRLRDHERWTEAVALGATHIHALVVRTALERDRLEQGLIWAYRPTLNTQHVPKLRI